MLNFSIDLHAQDSLMTSERMVNYLYAVYLAEGKQEWTFEECLLNKAEKLCYKLLEEDSTNYFSHYYLTTLYYNEWYRMQDEFSVKENLGLPFIEKMNLYYDKDEYYYRQALKYKNQE